MYGFMVANWVDCKRGEPVGDECSSCGAELLVPTGTPHDKTHRTLKGDAEKAHCSCAWPTTFRGVTAEVYAEKLIRLVAEDRHEFPDTYAGTKSWTDLHGVCDANEYLIAADEELRWDDVDYADNEYVGFCNRAIDIAERTLFGGAS